MVTFVLEDDGGKALNFLIHTLLRGNVRITDADFTVALHKAAEAWNGKASFRAGYYLSGEGVHLNVHICLEWLSGLIEALHQDDAAVNANLRSGNAYTVL